MDFIDIQREIAESVGSACQPVLIMPAVIVGVIENRSCVGAQLAHPGKRIRFQNGMAIGSCNGIFVVIAGDGTGTKPVQMPVVPSRLIG